MTKLSIVKLFKQYPWLLLLLLATLQLAGVLFLSRHSNSPSAPQSTSNAVEPSSPLPTASVPSALTTPPPTGSKAAKSATKSATKSTPQPSASPASPQAKPALTAQQQALNQQYKQSFVNSGTFVDSLIEMRVAIVEGASSLSLGSSTAATLMDQDRNPLATLSAGTSYRAEASGSSIMLNASQLPTIVLLEPANGGTFYLGDRTYRGRLLLVNDTGKLWAVNLVNLRSYLHSVVASEVSPSWPPEALKAQAIAARSYALTYYFKPISSLFHLGATEYYQVYSGIAREAPETNQAVDATAGEFVSYRGGIVESLYAASDDIVAEAFQGHGMSQLGALNLAEQGYNYQQILANYYPGTGVSRITQDYE